MNQLSSGQVNLSKARERLATGLSAWDNPEWGGGVSWVRAQAKRRGQKESYMSSGPLVQGINNSINSLLPNSQKIQYLSKDT
jgi:hypothetical protein